MTLHVKCYTQIKKQVIKAVIKPQSVYLAILVVCVTKPLLFTIVTRGLVAVFTLGKGSSSSKVGKLVGKVTKIQKHKIF